MLLYWNKKFDGSKPKSGKKKKCGMSLPLSHTAVSQMNKCASSVPVYQNDGKLIMAPGLSVCLSLVTVM